MNGNLKLVALKNGQLIIGQAIFQVSEFGVNQQVLISVKEPRVLIPLDDGRLQVGELIGQPDEITLTDEPVYFSDVKTTDIRDVYLKATTGLVLAH